MTTNTEQIGPITRGYSTRLTGVDLTRVSPSRLQILIRDEALSLFEGERAIVWEYRPSRGSLFAAQEDETLRSLAVAKSEALDLLGEATVWGPQVGGHRRRLLEASFGVANATQSAPTIALPLSCAGVARGVLLLQPRPDGEAIGDLSRLGLFAEQAGTLMSNHAALERSRLRQSQLEALYETAGEVVSSFDPVTALGPVVERVRHLAGTPVAYLMLVQDTDQQFVMQASEGLVTRAFAEVRLDPGHGLGGMVASEQRPCYTPDYLNDGRIMHHPGVDSSVRGEGLRSILGVPMRAFDRFSGVVFAADRAAHSFTADQLQFLVSLSDHAAAAIEKARLYNSVTLAMAALQDAQVRIEAQNARYERSARVHEQLSEMLLEGDGLPGMVGHVAELIGRPVALLDDGLRLIASAGQPTDAFGAQVVADGLRQEARPEGLRPVLEALSSLELAILEPRPPDRTTARLIVPLVAGAQLLGSIWVEIGGDDRQEVRHVVEQAVRVVACELLRERSIAEVERRLGREFLDDLLSSRPPAPAVLSRRAKELDVDLEAPHRLLVVLGDDGPHGSARWSSMRGQLLDALRQEGCCAFAAESGEHVIALIRPGSADELAGLERLIQELRAAGRLRGVLSPRCANPAAYRSHFIGSRRILEMFARSRHDAGAIIDTEQALVLALLFREGGESDLTDFAESRLAPILAQSPEHRDELIRTLDAYVEENLRPQRVAEHLHVHVNTVYYRLKRLRELLGEDFANPQRILDLQVALLVHRLGSLTSFQSET